MESLEDFLIEAAQEEVIHEVVVSERLAAHPFKVRPMTNDEYRAFSRQAYVTRGGKREFDNIRFSEALVLNCVVEPEFKRADWLNRAGVSTPEALIHKVLRPGEINRLGEEIAKISGFGAQSIEDEAYDEAKKP